jgi:hypothetical protein
MSAQAAGRPPVRKRKRADENRAAKRGRNVRLFLTLGNHVDLRRLPVERSGFEPHASGRCIRGQEAFFYRA